MRSVITLVLLLAAAIRPAAGADTTFVVDLDGLGNSMTAVFDSAVGERITAVSSKVSCTITVDEAALQGMASCSIPLTSIAVDNTPTKSEHFQQWATNKKSEPDACRIELTVPMTRVPGPVTPDKPVQFTADGTFHVCGRPRDDKGSERIAVTATYLPKLGGDGPPALRIRAHLDHFDRERYGVSPRATAGWLARVEQLSDVVATEGVIDVSVVAVAKP